MNESKSNHAAPAPNGRKYDSYDGILDLLSNLAERGGPAPEEYPLVRETFDRIHSLRSKGAITDSQHDLLWNSMGAAGTPETLMGFIYRKPHGYHGDFEIIDRFYTRHVSSHPHFERWDRFVHTLESVQAVRNRKDFLISLLRKEAKAEKSIRLLNVGSGPCRDLLEAFHGLNGTVSINASCVDVDSKAIQFGRSLLSDFAHRVDFIQQNILRLRKRDEFDIAWSAGLFDYLNDRLFSAALKRMFSAVKPGGKVIIGNFSTNDPSRTALEWGNWKLIYRTPAELLSLSAQLELPEGAATVVAEPLGVNLFLQIIKPET